MTEVTKTTYLLKIYKYYIVENVIKWLKEKFSIESDEIEKYEKNLNFVLTAYTDDLVSYSDRNIKYIGSKYWFNDIRQVENHLIEIEMQNFMADYIVNDIVENNEDKRFILNLKDTLLKIIEFGPEFMTYSHMHKYRYIMEYDTEDIPDLHLIKQSLHEAWNTIPSKQNFMPYNIFVLGPGPEYKEIKDKIYYKALVNEYLSNSARYDVSIEDPKSVEKAMLMHRAPPQYINLKTAPYVLICTQRIEYEPNPHNLSFSLKGWNFEQMESEWKINPQKNNRAYSVSLIEIGMFIQSFSNLCLMHNIDISHTRCLPTNISFWSEPEFSFLENPPQLILTVGKGKTSRREYYRDISHSNDYRPDFEKVVKFV